MRRESLLKWDASSQGLSKVELGTPAIRTEYKMHWRFVVSKLYPGDASKEESSWLSPVGTGIGEKHVYVGSGSCSSNNFTEWK